MKYFKKIAILIFVGILYLPFSGFAQFNIEGDYRFRFYNDRFSGALDDRGNENYIRQIARLTGTLNLNSRTNFVTQVVSFTETEAASPARNIAGTGPMYYGLTKVYLEYMHPNLGFIDVLRLRLGRQQFPLGKGLSHGESYYYYDKFDGARADLRIKGFNLSLFGSITGQNVSSTGLYPDPGSDQIYIAKLTKEVFKHELLGYYIYNKLRGDFNDSYLAGGGVSASFLNNSLQYFVEGAYQHFNTIEGFPSKHGIGYMAGISYMFRDLPVFKYMKIETRYVAYQGDDESTDDFEQFSPLYTTFYWGDRRGWANGVLGGDFPHNGQNLEGTRIWYSRIYFVPHFHPAIRLQFQYLKLGEYVNNDNYDGLVSEYGVKLYYRLSRQLELQLRYIINNSNDEDYDLSGDGQISWSEDRVDYSRIMFGIQAKF